MLSIQGISKTYANGVQALKNVSLEIGNGMFGLLGPNGAGKSSLMRTLAALQTPDEGSVVFEGVDLVKKPQHVRECLGYLPQDFGVYPKISCQNLLNHLALLKGLTHKGERKEMVAALLHQTNLYDARKKAVSSFSGGMRQRFGIAQALLGKPRLLIVDEPTAGLDPEERNRFHTLLSKVGEDMVVILSTHMVEDVRDLCAQMAILAGGEVKLQGKPKTFIDQLKGKVWRGRPGKTPVEEMKQQHKVLSSRLVWGEPQLHILADTAPEAGFEPVDPHLEDVYFAVLMGHGMGDLCS